MKFNFKVLAFALLTMLCFSFGCAPTSSAAASEPSVQKHSVKYSPPGENFAKVFDSTENPTQASVYKFIRNDEPQTLAQTTVQILPDAPSDGVFERNCIFDTTFTITRLTEIIPPRINFKDTGQYVSKDRQSPEVVMLS